MHISHIIRQCFCMPKLKYAYGVRSVFTLDDLEESICEPEPYEVSKMIRREL